MKTEEAKRIAMGLRIDFKCESDTMVDFCSTIIKALEQEPCEDCISRKKALTEIDKDHRVTHQGVWNECVSAIIHTIEDLPPVTPTHKKGRWIEERNGWDSFGNEIIPKSESEV